MERLALFLLCLAANLAQAAPTTEQLVGIWQCTHEIAAGWNETFRFFPNGTVIWNANQMDDEKRLIERRGKWSLEGNSLRVELTEETVLVGGRHARQGEANDGESMWVGSKSVKRKMAKPTIEVTPITTPKDQNGYPSMNMFERRFWRMKADPKDYS